MWEVCTRFFFFCCVWYGFDGGGNTSVRWCELRCRGHARLRVDRDAGNAAVWVWGRDVRYARRRRRKPTVLCRRHAPPPSLPSHPLILILQSIIPGYHAYTYSQTLEAPLHCLRAVHEALDLDSISTSTSSSTSTEHEGRGLAALGRLFGGEVWGRLPGALAAPAAHNENGGMHNQGHNGVNGQGGQEGEALAVQRLRRTALGLVGAFFLRLLFLFPPPLPRTLFPFHPLRLPCTPLTLAQTPTPATSRPARPTRCSRRCSTCSVRSRIRTRGFVWRCVFRALPVFVLSSCRGLSVEGGDWTMSSFASLRSFRVVEILLRSLGRHAFFGRLDGMRGRGGEGKRDAHFLGGR
jgi:hypothetical protein